MRLDESDEVKNEIFNRITEFKHSEFNTDPLEEIFLGRLIRGELVMMMGSQHDGEFVRHWKYEKSYFQVSSHKYDPNYSNYLISKKNPVARLLYSMYVFLIIYISFTRFCFTEFEGQLKPG